MKIIIIIMIFLCTGCIKNEDFNKTCTYYKKNNYLREKTVINVEYDNEDNINQAIIIKNYKSKDSNIIQNIKDANKAYNKKYADEKITIKISKDDTKEYEIKYKLDVKNIDDNILKEFKLKKNSVKFFNQMNKENIDCEE